MLNSAVGQNESAFLQRLYVAERDGNQSAERFFSARTTFDNAVCAAK